MSGFSPEEQKLLAQYVTDPVGDVFCIKGMPGMVGAAYARYSRARGGFREVLLKEFIEQGVIDPIHAEQLIQRILVAYGDDSVGELEGAHVSFENISILATKEIEESRIGGSPIEQSTRYVFYDQKDGPGQFRYYRDPGVLASSAGSAYIETMDFLFQTYCDLIEPMVAFYEKLKPFDSAQYDVRGTGEKQRAADLTDAKDQKAFRITYKADIRTRACDTLRYLLPLATKTNVGLFGNGRFFQGVVSWLATSRLPEANAIGEAARRELTKLIPSYVRRAKRSEYQARVEHAMASLTTSLLQSVTPVDSPEVRLLGHGEQAIARSLAGQLTPERIQAALEERFDVVTIATMLYAYAQHPLEQLMQLVEGMAPADRQRIVTTYVGDRKTRRDRPYRALEAGYPYTFDLVTDFGTYKDLMRHRMTTQLRQRFSPQLGFVIPDDLSEAGFAAQAQACHERSRELYDRLTGEFPDQAQYAALHGSKIRWLMGMNEREAYHLLELRTTPQGHPSYRRISQLMHRAIEQRSAWRAANMKFVDHNRYDWSRADSEAKQRVKERKLEGEG